MEYLTLLTIAKNAGFDIGQYIALFSISFIFAKFVKNQNKELREFVKNQNQEFKAVVNEQVDKIVGAIGTHNERLQNLETDMTEVKKKLDVVSKNL